jgi:hypothetical protein
MHYLLSTDVQQCLAQYIFLRIRYNGWSGPACLIRFTTHTSCQACQDYGDHWMLIVNCVPSRPQEGNLGFSMYFSVWLEGLE